MARLASIPVQPGSAGNRTSDHAEFARAEDDGGGDSDHCVVTSNVMLAV